MSKDYKFYEITYLDNDNKTGIAKFIRNVKKPQVDKTFSTQPINTSDRVICMYMTHNDESCVPTDGTFGDTVAVYHGVCLGLHEE